MILLNVNKSSESSGITETELSSITFEIIQTPTIYNNKKEKELVC
jgi:hypothetical protein